MKRLRLVAAILGVSCVSNSVAAQTFDVAEGDTATVASDITGAGSVTKTGLGTLILEGNNSYTGGTNVVGRSLARRDGQRPRRHRQQR